MQVDISEKQRYLCAQIIEGGYNPDDFQEYLCQKNSEAGTNLELWPMAELIRVTEEFQKLNAVNSEKANTQAQNSGEQPPQQSQKQNEDLTTESPALSNASILTYANKHEIYQQTLTTRQAKLSQFYHSGDTNTITIKDYEKREGGVFQKSYIIYKIRTNETTCERRYSDFEWLKDTLMILHPGIPIPPISKKGKMRRYDEKYIFKRMYILQKFLNKVNSIKQIRADELYQKFLQLPTRKEFEQYKQKYKKLKAMETEKIETIDGKIQLRLNDETNTFIARSQKYLSMTQPEVKKIYKDFKGAATMLENCSSFLKSVGQNCQTLSSNYRRFRKECCLPQYEYELFSLLEEMTSRYSELLAEQAKTFRKQIYSLVKYESLYMTNMLASLQDLALIQQNFIEQKSSLIKKKEKLFQQANVSKWGLSKEKSASLNPKSIAKEEAFAVMLEKETKQLLKQRQSYAFTNTRVFEEAKRHFTENEKYLYKYFEEIVKMESDISSRSIMIWADVLTKAKGLLVTIN